MSVPRDQNIFFFTTLPKMFLSAIHTLISITEKISARSMPEMFVIGLPDSEGP